MDVPTKIVKVDEIQQSMNLNGTSTQAPYIHLLSQCATATYSPISAKLYPCKMYTGNEIIRDFVPCIKPSGEAGLYDLVGGTFYPNAGTDTFTAGSAV